MYFFFNSLAQDGGRPFGVFEDTIEYVSSTSSYGQGVSG
jgi:hypothetical protein